MTDTGAGLRPDLDEIATFVETMFCYADPGSFVALRAFRDDVDGVWNPSAWSTPAIPEIGLGAVVDAAVKLAEACAAAPEKVVFAPPVATFKSASGAAERDIANGLDLMIECDEHPEAARERLENLLGPATVTIASGGTWVDEATGQIQDKSHVHWRLARPARTAIELLNLKEARRLAVILVGADASAVPLVHPLRWPGSVHRKGAPRLAHTVELRAEAEIDLNDALERLREAVAAMPKTAKPGNGADHAAHRTSSSSRYAVDLHDVVSALFVIPNDDRQWEEWGVRVAGATWNATSGSEEGFAAFLCWSAKHPKFDHARTRARWDHIANHQFDQLTAGTLFHMAREAMPEWVRPSEHARQARGIGEPPPEVIDAEIPVEPIEQMSAEPTSARPVLTDKTTSWSEPAEEQEWPEIDGEAFHGLAGNVVRTIEPHTEADGAGLLISFLTMAGNMFGRGPHAMVGAARHGLNDYAVLVGPTSKGRKGTSAAEIRRVMSAADSDWAIHQIETGLSSGEGVIWRLHDQIISREKVKTGKTTFEYKDVVKEENVKDKRLMIIEPEFGGTLAVMKREASTLSRVLRDGWDGQALATLTKNSPVKATGAHISIVAHVTLDELRRELDRISLFNGFANRFLFACVRRAQLLPFGGSLDDGDIIPLAERLRSAIEHAEILVRRPFVFDKEARAMWEAEYRTGLSVDHPGLFGAVVARAEAHTLRLAALYTALDGFYEIGPRQLRAALAVWRYCAASARYIFGDAIGEPFADEILIALRQAAPDGLTRTDISSIFGRNLSADQLGGALRLLVKHGKAMPRRRPRGGPGRPTEIWVAA